MHSGRAATPTHTRSRTHTGPTHSSHSLRCRFREPTHKHTAVSNPSTPVSDLRADRVGLQRRLCRTIRRRDTTDDGSGPLRIDHRRPSWSSLARSIEGPTNDSGGRVTCGRGRWGHDEAELAETAGAAAPVCGFLQSACWVARCHVRRGVERQDEENRGTICRRRGGQSVCWRNGGVTEPARGFSLSFSLCACVFRSCRSRNVGG